MKTETKIIIDPKTGRREYVEVPVPDESPQVEPTEKSKDTLPTKAKESK